VKIALFVPCYMDAFFPEVPIATPELLERLGHEIEVPPQQACAVSPSRTVETSLRLSKQRRTW